MNILIIGNGGREHALAWKLSQSNRVNHIYLAAGNGGTALETNMSNIAIDPLDFTALVAFTKEKSIDLTVVGPEAPLVKGIVDHFRSEGLLILGPTAAAAQLEGSKYFAKQFMQRYHIPTAQAVLFKNKQAALDYVETHTMPVVIKADGLASGKGVIVAQTLEVAITAIHQFMESTNAQLIIEDYLIGEEVSFIVMSDGETVLPLATSQDHKALLENDQGPNTGGLGAYSPATRVSPALYKKIMKTVILPTILGMKSEGEPYTGFLYAGLMISPNDDFHVLEFNCRLGDPETQAILFRLDSDLASLCLAAVQGDLYEYKAHWKDKIALSVVMASSGYPGEYQKGYRISGLQQSDNPHVKIFHANTLSHHSDVVTAGGRVLCITALGDTLESAQKAAYATVNNIDYTDAYYRRDIGYRSPLNTCVSTTETVSCPCKNQIDL
ncbi:MAG: phosphoribosylamine--glycine ligase [Endozoicomonadaceae bacterium]|nr:phosphoribosylamine--glycine ligase [Endozoicomonadaceae bacterium]